MIPEKTAQQRHNGMMSLYNSAIADAIVYKNNISYKEAIDSFYNSRLYDLYEKEETKIWHFSCVCIADLLAQELEKGYIDFPVEG